jgi:hypothetical protein
VYERSAAAGYAPRAASAATDFCRRGCAPPGRRQWRFLRTHRQPCGTRGNFDWHWEAWTFSTQTRGELNDSEDDAFASRWIEIGAQAQWAWSPRWTFTAGGTWRETHHPAQEASPDAWNDRRSTIRLGVINKWWKQAQVFVRYEHERNASPLDAYEYNRNWIAASIEYWR